MLDFSFLHSDTFGLVLLPILIFFARIADVTIGTVRIIFVSRGLKYLAPVLGFFEVTIWLLVISQVMRHMDSPNQLPRLRARLRGRQLRRDPPGGEAGGRHADRPGDRPRGGGRDRRRAPADRARRNDPPG